MGSFKKEKARRVREGTVKDGNLRMKGENFYRDAKKVKLLNMYRGSKAQHNKKGEVIQAAHLQSTDIPNARVQPDKRWFGNTRVISQDALNHFREAVGNVQKDSYQVLMRQNKLPMSLVEESTKVPTLDITETESYASTFGPKAQRRKPRVAVNSLEDLASDIAQTNKEYDDRVEEQQEEFAATQREAIFSKGQSKRIWNELYKVIDSSDVLLHVLDARDPLGTRCRAVEQYLKKDASHKHLVFVLNKCDLVPTWVSVSTKTFHR